MNKLNLKINRISDNNHKDVLEGIAHSEERVKIATEKRKK